MRTHVARLVHHRAAQSFARFVKIARHLGLPIHHHGLAARELLEMHPIQASAVGDEEALMDQAFAIHALAHLRFAHQLR